MRPRNGHACVASGDARVRDAHLAVPDEEPPLAGLSQRSPQRVSHLHAQLHAPLHHSTQKVLLVSLHSTLTTQSCAFVESTTARNHNGSHSNPIPQWKPLCLKPSGGTFVVGCIVILFTVFVVSFDDRKAARRLTPLHSSGNKHVGLLS